MQLLTEGVYDKGIFKAVFMAGGPGSGKSFIASNIFGIPEKSTTSIGGLKVINSDHEFKYLLKKYGFDPEWLDQYPPGTFDEPGGLRDFAKDLNKQRKMGYLDGKMGMIIDGTGHNFKKIRKERDYLHKQGYDTYMVFVMTSLETALKRNVERGKKGDRVLDAKIVEKSWRDTRKNLGAYKALFKQNLKIVYNDKYLEPRQARHYFANLVDAPVKKFLNTPIKNPIGKKWVQDQIELKNRGVK
jgi:predicted kinase